MNLNNHILNIALVDDDLEDQVLLEEALSELEAAHKLTCYNNCRQLIVDIEKYDICYDIIFLDLVMPLYDGKECLRRLN